jgi:ABC-type glycerol-3-phosphate transport system permease component
MSTSTATAPVTVTRKDAARPTHRAAFDPGAILRHALLLVFAAVVLLPLTWILASSFKSVPELYRVPTTLFPTEPTLDGYRFVLTQVPKLPLYYENSLVVTIVSVALAGAISCLAGYAFARLEFPGRDPIFWTLVVSLFLPTSITSLIAVYDLTSRLQLLDTWPGLILPYTAGHLIVSTFIMRSVYMSVPGELEDAARIDGCGRLQVFARIMVPLGATGLAVTTILNFISIWGEYLIARTLTYEQARTLPVQITLLQPNTGEWHFNTVTAAYMLMFGPAFLVLVVLQRRFLRGVTEGALKF